MSQVINASEIDPISRSKTCCLQIITEDRPIYRFCAPDEESLAKWLGALKSIIVARKRAVEKEKEREREKEKEKEKAATTVTVTAPATATRAATAAKLKVSCDIITCNNHTHPWPSSTYTFYINRDYIRPAIVFI